MALSGHGDDAEQCLLSGVKREKFASSGLSAYDPDRSAGGPSRTNVLRAYLPLTRIVCRAMPDTNSTVLVIDDDPNLRASVRRLLGSLGLQSRQFFDFLWSDLPDGPST